MIPSQYIRVIHHILPANPLHAGQVFLPVPLQKKAPIKEPSLFTIQLPFNYSTIENSRPNYIPTHKARLKETVPSNHNLLLLSFHSSGKRSLLK